MAVLKYRDPTDGLIKPLGLQGPAGPQGPQGPQGELGMRGLTGPQGPSGYYAAPEPPESTNILWYDTDAPDMTLGSGGTPDAHGSTHSYGGSDAITIAQSQVTNLTADLAAKASTTYAAERATVGNLLTANQASGGDTLGSMSGFANYGANGTREWSTEQAARGTGSLKITSVSNGNIGFYVNGPLAGSRWPVRPGEAYSLAISVRAGNNPRVIGWAVDYYTAAGAYVTSHYPSFPASRISTTAWAKSVDVLTIPETAAEARIALNTNGSLIGDIVYFDGFGFWAGAGGEWAMPGTPITNLGHKVTHPNVDDVLVQKWDSGKGRWQTVHYDSGVRAITPINGWTAVTAYLRRQNNLVTMSVYTMSSAAATSDTLYTLPTGFAPGGGDAWYPGNAENGDVLRLFAVNNTGTCIVRRTGMPMAVNATASFPTVQAIPTSLPGTLVSAAPA